MEQERTNWNDDRLDHLAEQVTDLRNHVDDRFDALSARMDSRFDTIQNSMVIALGSILAAFGGALVAIQF
jgi:hypothetical protein